MLLWVKLSLQWLQGNTAFRLLYFKDISRKLAAEVHQKQHRLPLVPHIHHRAVPATASEGEHLKTETPMHQVADVHLKGQRLALVLHLHHTAVAAAASAAASNMTQNKARTWWLTCISKDSACPWSCTYTTVPCTMPPPGSAASAFGNLAWLSAISSSSKPSPSS